MRTSLLSFATSSIILLADLIEESIFSLSQKKLFNLNCMNNPHIFFSHFLAPHITSGSQTKVIPTLEKNKTDTYTRN